MRRIKFEEYKEALKKRYGDIYNDEIHDPIVEDLVETYNLMARMTEAVANDQETQGMIYILRDCRLHYRQLLQQLLISFQSIRATETAERNAVNVATTVMVLSTQVSKLTELLQAILAKLPDAEREKYEKAIVEVLNGGSTAGDFEITV